MSESSDKRRRGWGALALLLPLAVASIGCDPAFFYDPVDGTGTRVRKWSEKIDGVEFSADQYVTHTGVGNTFGHLIVSNESNVEVFVVGAAMETNGKTLVARTLSNDANMEERTIPPGRSKAVELYWSFGGSASDVLGPDVTWNWLVRIGADEHVISVPMQRKER